MKINFIENFWNVENINDDNVLNVTGIIEYISSVCVTTLWLFLCLVYLGLKSGVEVCKKRIVPG